MNITRNTTKGFLLVASAVGICTWAGLAPIASAAPQPEVRRERRDVKDARHDVARERRDVRQANRGRERQHAQVGLRDAKRDLQRQQSQLRDVRRRPVARRPIYTRPIVRRPVYNRPVVRRPVPTRIYRSGGYRPGYGRPVARVYPHDYVGSVARVSSGRGLVINVGGRLYNVYSNYGLPRGLNRGDIVSARGERSNNSIRNASVRIVRNR